MSETHSDSLSTKRLILVPAIVSLAVTLLRLVGELEHWSKTYFNTGVGGGGAIIVITWLAPIFGIYFAIRLAADQNYGGFFSKEMRFRRMMHYPPVTALANIIAQDRTLEQAARVANEIGRFFAASVGESPTIKILGPTPAPLAKLEGRFRIQFLLKAKSRAQLNTVLRRLVDHCERERISRRSLMIDVDPVSIM